jgi:hypothetical protein
MSMSRIWILGAPDPEMEAIDRLLTEAGEMVMYAALDGIRCHPGNACRADSTLSHDSNAVYRPIPGGTYPYEIRYVECEIPGLPREYVIDHHQPGDPGYGMPPAEFLAASSIGQVISELARLGVMPETWSRYSYTAGWPVPGCITWVAGASGGCSDDGAWTVDDASTAIDIPRDLVLTAAADHCLGAAYCGECPGVDQDELMQWRAESRAAYQGRSVEEVLADIESAQGQLRTAEAVTLRDPPTIVPDIPGGWQGHCECCGYDGIAGDPCRICQPVTVQDMRRDDPVPELPEAAMRMGVAYISGPLSTPDGRRKITCSGRALQIRAFLDSWAPAEGLVDTYGDPARGFAGGYLPD